MEERIVVCGHCGNMAAMILDAGVPMLCCGEKMQTLTPGTVEAATEKHIPVYEILGNVVHVQIGAVKHPMEEQHFIQWIALHTDSKVQRKELKPGEAPTACFALCEGERVQAVYAYCNIHGLWKSE